MNILIKKIDKSGIKAASKLLTESFKDDKGVLALFKENEHNYLHKLNSWFSATLKMSNNDGFGAYLNDELVGIIVVTHTNLEPSTMTLLKWTYSVFVSCGFGTVKKSALHDQHRKSSLSKKDQYILEFIGVNSIHRGKGIGRQLFSYLHEIAKKANDSVWLETTKEINIKIFQKFNYKVDSEKLEDGIKYYIMTN